MKKLLFTLLLTFFAHAEDFSENRIMFLMTQKEILSAFDLYQEKAKEEGKHNLNLLQQMALQMIDQAFGSNEPEDQLMAIFGAAVANNSQTFHLLEKGMQSSYPQIQLITLNFLGKSHDDLSVALINRAIGSPYPIIRVEAAYQLALRKHPRATPQIEALMHKLPKEALPLIPKMLAVSGDENAIKILKKLISNPSSDVRCAASLAACTACRDDLMPYIRKLTAQHDARQQEAALIALAAFGDESSLETARKLSNSPHKAVQLAAYFLMDKLGDSDGEAGILRLANEEDVFAIYALRTHPKGKETLAKLMQNPSIQVRLNATLALLEMKDRRALANLPEILIRDPRDLAFTEITTPGRAISAWKVSTSASHQGDAAPLLHELSLTLREMVLEKTLDLPEKDFLQVAELLFRYKQNDLAPLLIQLLVNLDTKEAIQLLKEQEQKAGAPLIRNYAALGLVKLHEEGPYLDHLKEFVKSQHSVDIVKFRTFVPFEMRENATTFELTPEESARLLVEVLETLTETEDNRGIDLLLEVLKNGNSRNRPVIAGLLIRATE